MKEVNAVFSLVYEDENHPQNILTTVCLANVTETKMNERSLFL